MTTDPSLLERAYQAGLAGTEKPTAQTEVEQRDVDGFYQAGVQAAGQPERDFVAKWRAREGRIVEACKRAPSGTPGAGTAGVDMPHDPGG